MSGPMLHLEEKYDRLAEQLDAERKRREGVEDYWYAEQKAHTAAVTRAEQAERERDEARYMLQQAQEDAGIERHLRERAEADNEETVSALEVCREAMQAEGWDEYAEGHPKRQAYEACLVPAGVAHPGAAMLERMRALEKTLADAVAWMRNDGGAKEGGESCRHAGSCKWQRAESVLARADALKASHE